MKKTAKPKTDFGQIISIFSGVAKLSGLPAVFLHETLLDEKNNPIGIVIGFDEKCVEALLFDELIDIKSKIYRSKQIFSISINDAIVGRILDGLGRPIDDIHPPKGPQKNVFCEAPLTINREPIHIPLSTGIKVIDTSLPLGRGQRELIIGDRKLGKSTLAIDIALNQKNNEQPVYCIYVICGQKEQKLQDLINIFEQNNTLLYSTIVAATSASTFAEIYLAPFVGCAIGEYFRDQGKDALIIYDDLSSHAKNYRDIALLLERAPGREAYPGDVFSLHAGLLERAAKLSQAKGGGSLTALPIIETQEGDVTSFIPTNLISITDGQIYFERGLFQEGFLPAVNVGLSVSRIGAQAQPPVLREVTGGIRLQLAQHKELEKLAQLENNHSSETEKHIHRGELLQNLLKQEKHLNVSHEEQAILFYIIEEGFFDDLDEEEWRTFEKLFLELIKNRYFDIISALNKDGFNAKIKEKIKNITADFKQEFLA